MTSAPGVSQRLPISCMENVISNAERRAIRNREKVVVPRISDIYAALPAITGKLELEYEGEMKGADHVGRELIRTAIARTYDEYFSGVEHAADRAMVRPGRRDQAGGHRQRRRRSRVAARHPGPDGETGAVGVGPKDARKCRFRPPNSYWKACTPISASAAAKNACSRPVRSSPSRPEKPFEREEPVSGSRRPYN